MFWRRRRRPEPNVAASVYRRGDRVFGMPIFEIEATLEWIAAALTSAGYGASLIGA